MGNGTVCIGDSYGGRMIAGVTVLPEFIQNEGVDSVLEFVGAGDGGQVLLQHRVPVQPASPD